MTATTPTQNAAALPNVTPPPPLPLSLACAVTDRSPFVEYGQGRWAHCPTHRAASGPRVSSTHRRTTSTRIGSRVSRSARTVSNRAPGSGSDRIATASAHRFVESDVNTLPPVRMMSATGWWEDCALAATPQEASAMHATRSRPFIWQCVGGTSASVATHHSIQLSDLPAPLPLHCIAALTPCRLKARCRATPSPRASAKRPPRRCFPRGRCAAWFLESG